MFLTIAYKNNSINQNKEMAESLHRFKNDVMSN